MNNRIPKVAVITRTKDRGILLERAIKSVHNQTMEDFVHVIINDGGDKDVVDALVLKYHDLINGRVKVLHNKVSGGMEAASNKAIKSVASDYVAIHDDDDAWHPDFLRHTTDHLSNSGTHGVIVSTDKIDEEIIGNISVHEISRDRWMPHLRTLSLYSLCLDNFAVPISFLYKRSVFEEIGYYDETLPVCGDWDFALRFMLKYDIDFLRSDRALAYYHHRPKARGVLGNSIFAGADTHEIFRTKLENKYLREDINAGRFGIGYLFNERRQSRIERHELSRDIQSVKARIAEAEGMFITRSINPAKLKRLLQRFAPAVYERLKR